MKLREECEVEKEKKEKEDEVERRLSSLSSFLYISFQDKKYNKSLVGWLVGWFMAYQSLWVI